MSFKPPVEAAISKSDHSISFTDGAIDEFGRIATEHRTWVPAHLSAAERT
jgi:hypothetical protein